jgi:hypothetical protein
MEAGKVSVFFGHRRSGDKQVDFNVVPYLGRKGREVLKATSFTFPNPIMAQKEIIALFKQQALKQWVHLTTVATY